MGGILGYQSVLPGVENRCSTNWRWIEAIFNSSASTNRNYIEVVLNTGVVGVYLKPAFKSQASFVVISKVVRPAT